MLVYFSFPLIGCQYFRIKSIIVNDGDPFIISFFLLSFYLIQFLSVYISYMNVQCMWNVWEDDHHPSSSLIAWWLSVHVCVCVSSQTCYATRGMYLHIRNVTSMWICMFCSESNCLLKSRYVSSNPLRYYHQSVCVTTRELTYSLWTCQTAWFYGTCFKHSLRRLTDLSLSLALELILSFWLSVCLKLIDVRSSWTITAVETICFEWLHDCLSLIMMMMMVVYYGIRE
jgi:hypothetical protein